MRVGLCVVATVLVSLGAPARAEEPKPPPAAPSTPATSPPQSGAESGAESGAGTVSGGAPELAPAGRPCDKAFNNCPEGQTCEKSRCVRARNVRAMASGDEPNVVYVDRTRPFRLGVVNSFFFGLGGDLDNPSPAYAIGADFGFPTGRQARWHVELGYQDLAGRHGLKFSPFVLGYTIPVYEGPVNVEIEVIAAILQSEILFGDGYSVALSAGLRSQVVVTYGVGWAAFAPLGFEARYAYGVEDVGITAGSGFNWPLVLTLGVEL